MNIEQAKEVQLILNKIDYIKEKIEWLSREDRVLCFGSKPSEMSNRNIYADKYDNRDLVEILDKHHKMIIQELKDEIKELENQIEEI